MSGNSPLQFRGVGNLLDREYRNSPAYQWGRELARNGIEANAQRIQFGVEWEGVEKTGVYRLQYADDGHGMTKDDLREYMRTLGKGGKVVGGPHDNYALGGRMTLLPWNPEGVVVISVVDGEAHMVKMMYDPEVAEGEGEYVLEQIEWTDEMTGEQGTASVYPPYYDDVYDIDWAETIPQFIKDAGHGTTFVLLGHSPNDNTIDGDRERAERHRYLGRKYFNNRFFNLPDGVRLSVIEMPEDPTAWPKSRYETTKFQFRTVRGGESLIEYQKASGEQFVASKGTVPLPDGTKVHWWLRTDPKVDTGGLGASSGYIAVLYRGELYGQANADQEDGDTRIGAAVYRQFGIGSDSVRRRVFLIIDPPEYDERTGTPGVAPSTGRADLYWLGAGQSPRSVKPSDWSEDFNDRIPAEILAAINEEFASREHDGDREERLRRVMDRFGKRWRARRAKVQADGTESTEPTTPGTVPRQPIDSPTPRPRKPQGRRKVVIRVRPGTPTLGQPGTGEAPAKKTSIPNDLPKARWVNAEDIGDPGMIAAWQKPSANAPSGLVELDQTHPVVKGQIEYWQEMYPPAVALDVQQIVLDAYEEVAIAKVSHLHALASSLVISEEQRDLMLANPALTCSLLGLISEDALIGPRTGKLGTKRRRPTDDGTESGSEPVTANAQAGAADATNTA